VGLSFCSTQFYAVPTPPFIQDHNNNDDDDDNNNNKEYANVVAK
jgi:hypothetical protein